MDWACAACGAGWPAAHRFCGFCGQARIGPATAGAAAPSAEVEEVVAALVGEQLRAELEAHGGRLPDERRLVSALFADLSGFTPLAGRLDPERLAEVVDPLLAGLVRIVKRHGGHVGSFAGDALLAYFGAPVAHEDDAARAVRAAGEMLAEFPALLAAVPQEAASLSLRIGIDTGAVMARLVAGDIRTDYNILGNSVNMAQRLQSNAPPGGCVVGESTRRLTEDLFDYEDLGLLTVKGRAEPLPAFLLLRERRTRVQRRRARTSVMLGREADAARLAELEDAAVRGEGAVIALVAEAGSGKSRLIEERRAASQLWWVEGGCVVHDLTTPYRPWAAALAEMAADAATVGRLGDGAALVCGHPVPDSVAALSPARRRDLVAHDVAALLARAAPVVVVLEDLHWSDPSSLDLLDDLAHDPPPGVLLVVTGRRALELTVEVEGQQRR